MSQMISAYATGCLDKKNFVQLRQYLKKGGELPKGELGEQQNVMSLLPAVLTFEQPNERTKQRVVNKINEIQKKLRTKEREAAGSASFGETNRPEPEVSENKGIVEIKRKSLHETKKEPEIKAEEPAPEPEPLPEPAPALIPQKRSTPVFLWVLIFILMAAFIVTSLYFIQQNTNLQNEVAEIQNEIDDFQTEITSANKFIDDNVSLIEFFNYTDVRIVNLLPLNNRGNAWGRLLISFESGEGLLELKKMPGLNIGEVYQLWMITTNVTYPLAAITPRSDVKYYKISDIPYLPVKDINLFRITKESGPGVTVPEGTAYLYGMFVKEGGRR